MSQSHFKRTNEGLHKKMLRVAQIKVQLWVGLKVKWAVWIENSQVTDLKGKVSQRTHSESRCVIKTKTEKHPVIKIHIQNLLLFQSRNILCILIYEMALKPTSVHGAIFSIARRISEGTSKWRRIQFLFKIPNSGKVWFLCRNRDKPHKANHKEYVMSYLGK